MDENCYYFQYCSLKHANRIGILDCLVETKVNFARKPCIVNVSFDTVWHVPGSIGHCKYVLKDEWASSSIIKRTIRGALLESSGLLES